MIRPVRIRLCRHLRPARLQLSFRAFIVAVQSVYEIVLISLCLVLMFTLFRMVAISSDINEKLDVIIRSAK
jgi:uncharacterized membrane protein